MDSDVADLLGKPLLSLKVSELFADMSTGHLERIDFLLRYRHRAWFLQMGLRLASSPRRGRLTPDFVRSSQPHWIALWSAHCMGSSQYAIVPLCVLFHEMEVEAWCS